MRLDLNDPKAFNKDGVRLLIASREDSEDTQLRVTMEGIAYLSVGEVGSMNIGNLHCRFETWQAGNDGVGKGASEDDQWVNWIYQALKKNWPNRAYGKYIDMY